jgi:hypothetical protein
MLKKVMSIPKRRGISLLILGKIIRPLMAARNKVSAAHHLREEFSHGGTSGTSFLTEANHVSLADANGEASARKVSAEQTDRSGLPRRLHEENQTGPIMYYPPVPFVGHFIYFSDHDPAVRIIEAVLRRFELNRMEYVNPSYCPSLV